MGAVTIIVIVIATTSMALWRANKTAKVKKKFLNSLLHGNPIIPKHEQPKIIGESIPSLVTEGDRLFFGHFAEFAAVVNWWLSDGHVKSAWRLQELPNTELKLAFSDMPSFGRRYALFHKQVRIGMLELRANYGYSAENPAVHTYVKLKWGRLLSFGNIVGFLEAIASHVCDQSTREFADARSQIQKVITEVLWRTQQISEFSIDGEEYGELDLQLDGSAAWYFLRKQALRNESVKT
jgi:hypothetical protein